MYYYISYKYTLPGTNIHWITCLIIVVEALIFFSQLIHWLSRPSDEPRLWYLLFILLMIVYNTIGGLFVDKHLPIKLEYQLYFEVLVAVLVSMYFPFYIYYGLGVKKLEFYAWKGSFLFLFVPFVICFVFLNEIVISNVKVSLILFVAIINVYGAIYLYKLYRIVNQTLKDITIQWAIKERYIGVTVTITFWIGCLSCFAFVNVNQYTEHSLTNLGFLLMSYIFIRQSILDSRKEYNEIQNMNNMLIQKVKERTNELEYAIEQKTNTFISLAHEIRTPLTLVNNYLDDFIQKNGTSKELQIVKNNVEILNHDVNTFFKEEKFLNGLSTYNHSEIIDFSQFVVNKLAPFIIYANKKKITLTANISDKILIKADPDALHSIVNNLIENAIKYTDAQGIIDVVLSSANDKITLAVKDSGCGIPENLVKKVFDPYFQVNQNGDKSGVGIGLSILDNCVKSLSGKVYLASKINEGSEFKVELNQYIKDRLIPKIISSPINKVQIVDDSIDVKKPTIMVIEDHPDMLLYLKEKLHKNYNVFVAENGIVALAKLKLISNLDLIISDVMMAEMDGIELLKNISLDPDYCHIPFLFLTANTTSQNKHLGYSLGAIDYIQKPFNIHDLLLKVEAIISNNKKQIDFVKYVAFSNLSVLNNDKTLNNSSLNESQEMFDLNCERFSITKREAEIILLLQKSLTHKEIAEALFISEKTVHKHCENIFNKVQVNNKLDLLKRIHS